MSAIIISMKEEPVNITRQTIYAIIPILDLYAAYKIKKFWWYVVIMLGIGLGVSFGIKMVLPDPYSFFLEEVFTIPIAVYLIRKWSKKWNERFTNTNNFQV